MRVRVCVELSTSSSSLWHKLVYFCQQPFSFSSSSTKKTLTHTVWCTKRNLA